MRIKIITVLVSNALGYYIFLNSMYRNKRSTISTFLAELKTDGENGSVA